MFLSLWSSAVGHCRELCYLNCADLWPSCLLEFHVANKAITTAVAYFPSSGKVAFTVADIQRLFARMDFGELYLSQRSKYSRISSAESVSETANISIVNRRMQRLHLFISGWSRSKTEISRPFICRIWSSWRTDSDTDASFPGSFSVKSTLPDSHFVSLLHLLFCTCFGDIYWLFWHCFQF